MPILQKLVQSARKIVPRGWSPLLRYVAKIYPKAKLYPALMTDGDIFYLDLSENMCHMYFYEGKLEHEHYSESFFNEYLKLGDIFLDVGANIGYFSRKASKIVGEKGRVLSFEPMPSALRLLNKNTEGLNNVKIYNIAISNIIGESAFSIQDSGDTSSLGESSNAKKIINVKTGTLDNLLINEERIDFIKIDVEGYELEVLLGATNVIRKFEPLIYFEYIDKFAKDRNITVDKFGEFLRELGYSFGWINMGYPHGPLITNKPSCYIIAAKEKNRWGITFEI